MEVKFGPTDRMIFQALPEEKKIAIFNDGVKRITEAIKHLSTPEDEAQYDRQLNHAYTQLCDLKSMKGLEHSAAQIFHLFGQRLYGGDMPASRTMYELSLVIELVGLNVLSRDVLPFFNEETLRDLFQERSSFKMLDEMIVLQAKNFIAIILDAERKNKAAIENILNGLNEEDGEIGDQEKPFVGTEMLEQLFRDNQALKGLVEREMQKETPAPPAEEEHPANQNELFLCAKNLRGMGYTAQNIDAFNGRAHLTMFRSIYTLACTILTHIDTPNSKWDMVDIFYNSDRFVHHMKYPGDVSGSLGQLQKLYPYLIEENGSLRAKTKLVQCVNIFAIELDKLKNLITNLGLKKQIALQVHQNMAQAAIWARQTPGFDSFLKVMFLHNRASSAVTCAKEGCHVASTEEISGWYDTVLVTIKEYDYNHYYYANYLNNAAEFELTREDFKKALEYLEEANKINEKYPDSCKNSLKKTQELSEEVKKQDALIREIKSWFI